jgi:hypothetical protein
MSVISCPGFNSIFDDNYEFPNDPRKDIHDYIRLRGFNTISGGTSTRVKGATSSSGFTPTTRAPEVVAGRDGYRASRAVGGELGLGIPDKGWESSSRSYWNRYTAEAIGVLCRAAKEGVSMRAAGRAPRLR